MVKESKDCDGLVGRIGVGGNVDDCTMTKKNKEAEID